MLRKRRIGPLVGLPSLAGWLRPLTLLSVTALSLTALAATLLAGALPAAAAPPDGQPLPPDVAVGTGAPALPDNLSAESWLVADLTEGKVLAARAGSAKRAPASTLKILTALTAAPSLPPEIEVQPEDTRVDGRRVGLRPGVRYPSAALLDALFVASGNDVAQALARGSGGDPASAPDRMTQLAQQLGATDTTASNVTGLDAPGQLTTAYDLAILTRAALARPDLRRSVGLAQTTLTGSDGVAHRLTTTNPLLGRYAGAIGVKTGSTADAGNTFVGAAERDGHLLVAVLLEAPASFGKQAEALLDWGFRAVGTTSAIAVLPAPAAPGGAARPADDPPAVPMAEDGGGISPLLALALAITVVAAAFTYWQGRERAERQAEKRKAETQGAAGPGDDAAANPTPAPDGGAVSNAPEDADPAQSPRDPRRILAP